MKSMSEFVNSQEFQLAKRELSETVRAPAFWLGFACVMAVLTVSAPFDSGEEFSFPGRALYWTGISLATFFPAALIIRQIHHVLVSRGHSAWGSSLVGGLVAGVPVGLIVFAINSYIAGNDDGELKDIPRLIALCTPITAAVALLTNIVVGTGSEQRADPQPQSSRLMQRLKPELRGDVLSLQAQDHYVEVTTDKGADLVLIRLSDAIAELGDADGLQVHRSWWVSKNAVKATRRDAHKLDLTLTDDRTVPVGRSRQKDVLAWYKSSA